MPIVVGIRVLINIVGIGLHRKNAIRSYRQNKTREDLTDQQTYYLFHKHHRHLHPPIWKYR